MTKAFAFAVTVSLGVAAVHAAADWPQWQGPDRTRISKETGLLKEWPSGGPRLIWMENNLGTGYGSMAVAGGHAAGVRHKSEAMNTGNTNIGKDPSRCDVGAACASISSCRGRLRAVSDRRRADSQGVPRANRVEPHLRLD